MADEKRVIEGYEVKHAIQLAGGEVIFAVNPAAEQPYMVCDCSWGNPLNIEEYKNALVGDDPVEMLRIFTDRLSERMTAIEAQRAERGISHERLTAADCISGGMDTDLEGKVVVIKPEKLSPEYQTIDHQLALCTGGNGARPNARGRAVFVTDLYSGESSRWNRQDIAGVLLPERMPNWGYEKLTALQKPVERESVIDKIRQDKTQSGPDKNDRKERAKGGPER